MYYNILNGAPHGCWCNTTVNQVFRLLSKICCLVRRFHLIIQDIDNRAAGQGERVLVMFIDKVTIATLSSWRSKFTFSMITWLDKRYMTICFPTTPMFHKSIIIIGHNECNKWWTWDILRWKWDPISRTNIRSISHHTSDFEFNNQWPMYKATLSHFLFSYTRNFIFASTPLQTAKQQMRDHDTFCSQVWHWSTQWGSFAGRSTIAIPVHIDKVRKIYITRELPKQLSHLALDHNAINHAFKLNVSACFVQQWTPSHNGPFKKDIQKTPFGSAFHWTHVLDWAWICGLTCKQFRRGEISEFASAGNAMSVQSGVTFGIVRHYAVVIQQATAIFAPLKL